MKAGEIDVDFIKDLKDTFGTQEIDIVVSEFDETEYLLKSEPNTARLLKGIDNIKNGRNLIEVDLDDRQLIEEAVTFSDRLNANQVIEYALREYVQRRQQLKVLELLGAIDHEEDIECGQNIFGQINGNF